MDNVDIEATTTYHVDYSAPLPFTHGDCLSLNNLQLSPSAPLTSQPVPTAADMTNDRSGTHYGHPYLLETIANVDSYGETPSEYDEVNCLLTRSKLPYG